MQKTTKEGFRTISVRTQSGNGFKNIFKKYRLFFPKIKFIVNKVSICVYPNKGLSQNIPLPNVIETTYKNKKKINQLCLGCLWHFSSKNTANAINIFWNTHFTVYEDKAKWTKFFKKWEKLKETDWENINKIHKEIFN